jgi:hypothetical protein
VGFPPAPMGLSPAQIGPIASAYQGVGSRGQLEGLGVGARVGVDVGLAVGGGLAVDAGAGLNAGL